MQDDARKLFLDSREDLLVVFNLQLGVETALKKDLNSALIDGVTHLVQDRFIRVNVALVMIGHSIEGTELAPDPANVGVVEDSANDIGYGVARHLPLTLKVRESGEVKRIGMVEKENRIFWSDALTGINLVSNRVDRDSTLRRR